MEIRWVALCCHSFIERETLALALKNDHIHVVQSFIGKSILQLNPIERCLLGFSLVRSGFPSNGVREISLSLEQMSAKLSCIGLFFLHEAFSSLQLKKQSEIVMRKFLSSDLTFLKQFNEHEYNAFEFEDVDSEGDIDLSFNENSSKSLKSKYIKFNKLISNSAINIHSGMTIENNLQNCFNAIIDFLPTECFKEMHFVIEEIKDLEFEWINKHLNSEITKGALQEYLTQSILPKHLKLFIHLKTVISFSYLYENKFDEAFKCFCWIKVLLSKLNHESLKQLDISNSELRSISLYYSICFLNLENTRMKIKDINDCISNIISLSTDFSIQSAIENGKLEFYFEILGLLYLEKAGIEDFVDKYSIEEMIRKFIIVSTLKYPDDPTISQIYTLIIDGILLYGGLEIRTLWFFNFLKQYFKLHQCVYRGLIKVKTRFASRLSKQIATTSEPILSRLMNAERGFTKDIREIIATSPTRKEFVAPYFQVNHSNTKDFYLQQTPRSFGYSSEIYTENSTLSNSFIDLWKKSYKDFQGDIPEDIIRYLNYLHLHT